MTLDDSVLDRIFDRLVRTLSAGGPDQLRAPFSVAEITHALVPYRTYRHELGVDTLQDYEHAVLLMVAGARGWLVADPDVVAVITKELASPDPDTTLLNRLQTAEVRMGAIRMPVDLAPRRPIARDEEDRRDTASPAPSRPFSAVYAVDAVTDFDVDDVSVDAATDDGPAIPVPTTAATAPFVAPVIPVPQRPTAPVVTPPPLVEPVTVESSTPPDHPPVPPYFPVAAPAPPPTTPIQSVQGVTLASAQTLARITPLSSPSVYGEPIDFRGVRHAPVDIGGVIFLFGIVARELGIHVESLSSGFPRCDAKRQMGAGRWQRLRIDFELESRHFRDAGRNPSACDLLICWRDTWPDRPSTLEVVSLERLLPSLPAKS
jgi:hypothetical protein